MKLVECVLMAFCSMLGLMYLFTSGERGETGGGEAGGGEGGSAFVIPEEYAGNESVSNMKSYDDLFKGYVSSQELIGKRPAGVPQENASNEDWEKFHETTRPETSDKYEFEYPDEMPKGFERNEEMEKSVKDIFHKAGLTSRQAKQIQSSFDKLQFERQDGLNADSKAQDDKFEETLSNIFGEEKDAILERTKTVLNDNVPPELASKIAALDGDSLALMAGALDGIYKKYIAEDGASGDGGQGTGGTSDLDKRTEARTLMASKAYKDFQDPEHESVKKKVADLYASLKE